MEKFVIVVHLMIVLAMIGFVLLQKSEGGGFAAGLEGIASRRARLVPSPRRGEGWGVTISRVRCPLTPTLSPAEVGCFRLRPCIE